MVQQMGCHLGIPTSHSTVCRLEFPLCFCLQLPASVQSARQQGMAGVLESMLYLWEAKGHTWSLTSAWPSLGFCGHLGNEPAGGSYLTSSSCLAALHPSHPAHKISLKYL